MIKQIYKHLLVNYIILHFKICHSKMVILYASVLPTLLHVAHKCSVCVWGGGNQPHRLPVLNTPTSYQYWGNPPSPGKQWYIIVGGIHIYHVETTCHNS